MKIPNPFAKATTQTNLTSGSDGTLVSQTPQTSTSVQNPPKVEQQIQALVPGQTLQGEVVAKNGSEITLKLAGDMVLTARLERELNLELGKILTFQVKNNGKMLSLSPLFANMAMETTAGKALDMANIPLTDRTLQMAGQMMEKGMPVDIASIQNVYKDVATFGDATVEHIVRLHQMNIPVTAENIEQLISYENLKHQLSMGVGQMVSDLQTEGLSQPLLGQMLQVTEDASSTTHLHMPIPSEEITTVLQPQQLNELATAIKGIAAQVEVPDNIQHFMDNPQTTNITVKEMLDFFSQITISNQTGSERMQSGQTFDMLSFVPEMSNPTLESQTNLHTEILGGHQVRELLNGPIMNKLLSAHLTKQWTLLPEQVSDKQKVYEVYERLTRQLEGLKQAVEASAGRDNDAFKSIHTLQNNINFMNHINQMYNYIQIPLTLNGKFSQGELYVYSGKKNLAKTDGTVSALLHLDMEHLGPVDVYVAMQNQNVTTNFYLETDELLDFIHEHIYILDEHLAKRGYSLTAKMMVRDELGCEGKGMSVMEQIETEDPEKMVLSHYSFDVRA